jgi:hypothetical protein
MSSDMGRANSNACATNRAGEPRAPRGVPREEARGIF